MAETSSSPTASANADYLPSARARARFLGRSTADVKAIKRTRQGIAKGLEVQGIISALMLSVAGSGFFAEPDLGEGFHKTVATISFCFSLFSFISAAIMSGAFLIPILDEELHPQDTLHAFGRLFILPQVYFCSGYVSLVVGATAYFLAMSIGTMHTGGCLAVCVALFMLPTFFVLFNIPSISRQQHPIAREGEFKILGELERASSQSPRSSLDQASYSSRKSLLNGWTSATVTTL